MPDTSKPLTVDTLRELARADLAEHFGQMCDLRRQYLISTGYSPAYADYIVEAELNRMARANFEGRK